MKLFTVAAVAAAYLSTISNAVIVGRGLPDGIYTLQGQQLQEPRKSFLQRRERLELWQKPGKVKWEEYSLPLPINGHSCNDKYGDLNQTDYKKAVLHMNKFCDDFDVSPRGMFISVVGQVMVYVCAYEQLHHCHHYEWEEAELAIDAACGERAQGYVRMDDWNKRYGRGHVGTEVCENMNEGQGKSYVIDSQPIWVNGDMYEAWKTGTSTRRGKSKGKGEVKNKDQGKGNKVEQQDGQGEKGEKGNQEQGKAGGEKLREKMGDVTEKKGQEKENVEERVEAVEFLVDFASMV